MYINEPIKKYLDDLSAKLPAPGGGSASALVGALGCALLCMVCNFTIGKAKYKDVEREIKEILKHLKDSKQRFLQIVDLDVKAYYKVFKSRKSAQRIYQRNLINATRVPLEICELVSETYKFCPLLSKKTNKYLISDVYVAKELLKSCFKSAEFNVRINLPHIKNKNFVSRSNKIIKNLRRLM
ncbi:MAG: cyclodeaminase/cyclohydrolase family protein [Candidatus Omnitrophota bacterium]